MRDVITAALELVAIALLALATGMALWVVFPPAGLAAGAVVLLGAAWLIDRSAAPRDEEVL